MANLTFIEKQILEKMFKMEGGYVIRQEFSNRMFQEFVLDALNFDVYQRYPYESKAKLLRKVFADETDSMFGKLIISLLEYCRNFDNEFIEDEAYRESVKIGRRLLGKSEIQKPKTEQKRKVNIINYSVLKDKLFTVEKILNPQEKGFALEKFLPEFFNAFGLDARGSFRIVGEQIDGSFDYNNDVYLVEAKWQRNKIGLDDFRVFTDKIEQKSHYTRGVFISFSECEEAVIQRYNNNQARFIIITIGELFIIMEREMPFSELLRIKLRALTETGVIYKHILN